MFKVKIIESERGWGTKIIEIKSFETEEERNAFIADFNKDENFDGPVPDYYIIARKHEEF